MNSVAPQHNWHRRMIGAADARQEYGTPVSTAVVDLADDERKREARR